MHVRLKPKLTYSLHTMVRRRLSEKLPHLPSDPFKSIFCAPLPQFFPKIHNYTKEKRFFCAPYCFSEIFNYAHPKNARRLKPKLTRVNEYRKKMES